MKSCLNFAVHACPVPKLLRRLALAGALSAAALAVLIFLVVDREPVVWQHTASGQIYFSAARKILSKTVPSPNLAKDKTRSIALSAEDLTALSNFALIRKGLKGTVKAAIQDRRLILLASVKLPINLADLYLNLRLIADDAEPVSFIKQVKAGFIALPKPLVGLLGGWLARNTHLGRYLQMTAPLIQEVRIGDEELRIVVNWERDVMGQARDLVADLADRERMRIYYAKLAEVVEQTQSRRFVGLIKLMRPLFALAKERSETEGGSPQDENRAVNLVLGAYANGRNLASAIFPGEEAPPLERRAVLLNQRVDAAQHFTASAVLVITGQRAFADLVGLAKEFNDTHGGTGFSFIDLAADRAGAIFGNMAVASEESARKLQDVLSHAQDESVFMPRTKDLPENLSAEEFAEQVGGIDSAKFLELKKTIEDRIAACRLYQ